MSINEFMVDTQAQINNTDAIESSPTTPKSSNKSKQTKNTVEQQIQEYKRSEALSDQLFTKYVKDGWDSIWNTPTLTKDTGGIKSIYLPNLTFLKLVEYFTLDNQSVCDVFVPPQRQEILMDLSHVNTTFVSNNEDIISTLQKAKQHLQNSPFHTIGNVELTSYNNLSGMYHLITVALPTYKDIPIKLGEKFNGTPQQYIALLTNIITILSTHLEKQGNMIILIKDFHDGKYIPVLPFIPHIIKSTGCYWSYTAVMKSGVDLPESLWIKFYQEHRFKLGHAYVIGLHKE